MYFDHETKKDRKMSIHFRTKNKVKEIQRRGHLIKSCAIEDIDHELIDSLNRCLKDQAGDDEKEERIEIKSIGSSHLHRCISYKELR